MHVRSSTGSTYTPLSVDRPVPVEFELDNFKGRCLFLHRPKWTYDNPETADLYPYRSLFHNRKRLWEWRLQGRFIRRPGVLYVGIELEDYVPVNFATRSLMRGILPLIQAALQCKMVHHDVGDPNEQELRPTVVAPLWAADNTLVHNDPSEVPDLASPELPAGLNRKAARAYWEEVWAGDRGEDWLDEGTVGPTFTFALWGPSQIADLRSWVFRKLPLMWGRELAMEPFCGKQAVHVVVYELSDGELSGKHYQSEKTYSADLRMMPASVWASQVHGDEAKSPERKRSAVTSGANDDDDALSFCSALSGDSPDQDQEQFLLSTDAPGASVSATSTVPPSRSRSTSKLLSFLPCLRCRKRRSATTRSDQMV